MNSIGANGNRRSNAGENNFILCPRCDYSISYDNSECLTCSECGLALGNKPTVIDLSRRIQSARDYFGCVLATFIILTFVLSGAGMMYYREYASAARALIFGSLIGFAIWRSHKRQVVLVNESGISIFGKKGLEKSLSWNEIENQGGFLLPRIGGVAFSPKRKCIVIYHSNINKRKQLADVAESWLMERLSHGEIMEGRLEKNKLKKGF